MQRVHCYLCDLPRTPWAILHEFTEPICRGCCNYEGPDRIEEVIDYARYLRKRWENQIRAIKSQSVTSNGTSAISSPSPGSHSSNNGSGIENGPPNLNTNGIPPSNSYHHLHVHQRVYPKQINGEEEHIILKHENGTPGDPYPKRFFPGHPGEHPVFISSDVDDPEKRPQNFPPRPKHDLPMPVPRRHPELGDLPPHVVKNVDILNGCVPFDVRFKKDHSLQARLISFEVVHRAGTGSSDFEVKIYMEYPKNSGMIYQSVSAVSKAMHQDSMKDGGKNISSGLKYLEYEVQGKENEWRLLSDFLSESVRFLKEPVSLDSLPVRVSEQSFPYSPSMNNAFKMRKRKMDEPDPFPPPQPSRAPRRTYKEREDEQIQRHLWMQSQVDALRLSMAQLTNPMSHPSVHGMYRPALAGPAVEHGRPQASVPPVAAVSSASPNHIHQHANHTGPMPPSPRNAPWGLPSSMAALISAAGSVEPASASSGSQSSSTSTTTAHTPDTPLKKSAEKEQDYAQDGSSGVEGKTESSESSGSLPSGTLTTSAKGRQGAKTNHLKCSICGDLLEDTHFVQCPSVGSHKFCFPCSKDSIKKQGSGSDVFCPSGKRCPLVGSNLPWAFMQSEIQTILATETKVKEEARENGEAS